MRSKEASRGMSGVRAWSWIAILSVVASAGAQQMGVVPTDHYGPPLCSAGAKPPVLSEDAARAHAEEMEGLRDAHALPSDEPLANFGVERYKLVQYADCTGDVGCYWADLDAQYKRAEGALKMELEQHKGEKLAIVMDIDETTLSNYCEMRREDFGYIEPMYDRWQVSPEASTAIPGALRLFHEARAAGVAVFFITGRPGVPEEHAAHPTEDQTPATAHNLEAAGFHGWAKLILRNGPENHMKTIAYKSSERRKITEEGYRIILSMGDQWSDLLGQPQADVSVKLPNPFYFLP